MELPKRKLIRLLGYDYSRSGYYFVTICTQDRNCIFGSIVGAHHDAPELHHDAPEKTIMKLNEMGMIVQNVWQSLTNRFPVDLDVCQIMPNHLHGIIVIKMELRAIRESDQFDRAIRESDQFDRAIRESDQFDRAIRESPLQGTSPKRSILSQTIGYFKMNSTKQIRKLKNYQYFPVWQRNYYEHIIRNELELNKIREYIKTNPLMWEQDRNNPISLRI